MVISVVDAWRTRSGPWIAAVNIGCIFILMVGFRIFRHYFRDIVVYHDYLVLSMFTVSVITCTLSNLNWLPEVFEGAGIEEYRSSFDGQFFIIAIFSLLSFKKALFLFSPLYLLS